MEIQQEYGAIFMLITYLYYALKIYIFTIVASIIATLDNNRAMPLISLSNICHRNKQNNLNVQNYFLRI